MNDYFELCNIEKFKIRTKNLLLESIKVFLCGMLWQAFAIASPGNDHSVDYYFFTGFGGSLGSLVGHLLLNINFQPLHIPLGEAIFGFVEAFFVVFAPEVVWQKIVNSTLDWEFTFTGAFFLMFLIISVFVITLSTSVRIFIKFIVNKEITYKKAFGLRFYLDIQAALAFALGDAFFIGTESSDSYKGNWLKDVLACDIDTPVFQQLMKAGASVMFGYLWISVLFNIILKDVFCDERYYHAPNLIVDKDGKIKRASITIDREDISTFNHATNHNHQSTNHNHQSSTEDDIAADNPMVAYPYHMNNNL